MEGWLWNPPGSSFKPIAFLPEHKAILITLSICNHNVLQLLHYCLGTFGHQIESPTVVRFCKVVLLSKPSLKKEKGTDGGESVITTSVHRALKRGWCCKHAASYSLTCFLENCSRDGEIAQQVNCLINMKTKFHPWIIKGGGVSGTHLWSQCWGGGDKRIPGTRWPPGSVSSKDVSWETLSQKRQGGQV